MRNLLSFAAAAAAVTSGAAQELIWTQSESYAIYTTAALARKDNSAPTFATSTYLNPPIFIESYNTSAPNGTATWSYQASGNDAAFAVDCARHAASTFGTAAVDTFAVELVGGTCVVTGFASSGPKANGKPVWANTINDCTANIETGGTYVALQASDDGTAVSFTGYFTSGTTAVSAFVTVYDGQTGKPRFTFKDPSPPTQGLTAINRNGTAVIFVNEPNLNVIDALTGKAIGKPIQVVSFIPAAISDDGKTVASSSGSTAYLWQLQGGEWTQTKTFNAPENGTSYDVWDMTMSTDDNAEEFLAVGYIRFDVLQVRVTLFSLSTGAVLTDYFTAVNTKLQENPTMRADRNYVGVSLWGDAGERPTAVLLKAGSNKPVFSYISPGSMFAVDVVVDSSTASSDTVYLTAAGKHVPANAFGNGGDAFAWKIVVPK